MKDNRVKVALVQYAPVLFDKEQTLDKMSALLEEVGTKGAEVVVFPEAFVPAYPWAMGFGTVIGSRTSAGRDQFLHYWENAIAVPGPETDRMGEMARKIQAIVVVGVIERDLTGTLYCTLLYFDAAGQLMGKHRKLKPTAAERIIWGEGDGSDLQVHDTPKGRIAGLICWENYMPLARFTLYQQGIQLYCAPTADARDSWQATMRHIALEGRCFVLGCNQVVTLDDFPEPYRAEVAAKGEVLCRGGSVVVSPLGEILAGPLFDQEGILYAELDMREIGRGKMDFDVAGHYNRPDVFEFSWRKA
ncbi:MAG: carbon-nitrogen hydrolase family protein [Saprospiraceae bacterium]|nr:carbon-nitrogen hydrolase family protein [Saprospiraceae bacterium]MDP4820847.1 carbon-nitrogen hydrolase family protein [Saprospiraceae bacterium]MDP5000106.1 carbon-nitrogen hydrolase family protein [Saprospiraceae bacterium]